MLVKRLKAIQLLLGVHVSDQDRPVVERQPEGQHHDLGDHGLEARPRNDQVTDGETRARLYRPLGRQR